MAVMKFHLNGKEYEAETAAGIVRAIEGDAREYGYEGGPLREFLAWSLSRLVDEVPQRDLGLGAELSDETLAFGYLCLLADHGLGSFINAPPLRL